MCIGRICECACAVCSLGQASGSLRKINVCNGDFNEFCMGCLSEEGDELDGPAKEVTKVYDAQAYDVVCTQSEGSFIFS